MEFKMNRISPITVDYEKKYKLALANARQEYNTTENVEKKQWLEELFPELKESGNGEDKRISKEITKFLKQNNGWNREWLTWLKKQGEQKDFASQEVIPRYSIGDVLCDKLCTTLNKDAQPNFEIVDIRNGLYICDKGSFPISQQDEYELVAKKIQQKSFNYENANIQQKDFAPKEEPKFEVGDWVVYNYPHTMYPICLITAINENYVELKDLNGGQFQTEIYDLNTNYHLWSIKDARNGDVLISQNNKPFIYNGTHDSIYVGSYCGISIDDKFKAAIEKCHWTENVNIYPATKEQRDTLMKAMTDAGYTFDFEKKVLKKIDIIK